MKIGEIRELIGLDKDQYMYNRAFDFAIEEFIEAIGFSWFLKVVVQSYFSVFLNNLCYSFNLLKKILFFHLP